MARRVPRGAVAAAALALVLARPAPAADPGTPSDPAAGGEPAFTVLAHHGFDGGDEATGPDTFRVFEQARGRVTRTPHFRWSGGWSVELRDRPRDGDFPELQGYFAPRTGGRLFVHFALLVTDPAEPFNVALAGPGWFRLGRDGLAFWLENRDGVLHHISDSIPRKLVALEPFTWYLFDLLYDVDAGRYELAIWVEGAEAPLVAVADHPNAASQPGSVIDKFSFIGDRGEDVSAAVYYVDEIVVGTDRPPDQPPFVAPGRRRPFVELLAEKLPRPEAGAAGCPPATAGPEHAAAGEAGAGRDAEALAAEAWRGLVGCGLVDEALALADRLAAAAASATTAVLWLERAGDSAWLGGDASGAGERYRRAVGALGAGGDPSRLLLRLADVAWAEGDLAAEKVLREAIYGTLDPRPDAELAPVPPIEPPTGTRPATPDG